jgi:hypothetical protein
MPNLINPNPNAQPFTLGVPGKLRRRWPLVSGGTGLALTPIGIGPAEQFGASTVTQIVTASGVGSSNRFGQPIFSFSPFVQPPGPAWATSTPSTQGVHIELARHLAAGRLAAHVCRPGRPNYEHPFQKGASPQIGHRHARNRSHRTPAKPEEPNCPTTHDRTGLRS